MPSSGFSIRHSLDAHFGVLILQRASFKSSCILTLWYCKRHHIKLRLRVLKCQNPPLDILKKSLIKKEINSKKSPLKLINYFNCYIKL